MKKVLVLGASGSIGRQSIDIIEKYPNKFTLTAFSVGMHSEVIEPLLKKHSNVRYVYLIDPIFAKELSKKYLGIIFFSGEHGLAKLTKIAYYDMCVDALVGFAGLEPAIIALKRNKILCLANKEALVVGGTIINKLLRRHRGVLYPIDSEHVAIAKCLSKCKSSDVDQLILTASGGALRDLHPSQLKDVKAKDALKHPTWKMGNKITIDCATMMNKGFEIIEAYYLFHYPLERIQVLMHDESLVHSLVKLKDGSYLLDYGKPDMHVPIEYAMFEGKNDVEVMHVHNLSELKDCHFHLFDPARYEAVEIAKAALKMGGSALAVLNAADEVVVNKFLNDEIDYLSINRVIKEVISRHSPIKYPKLKQLKSIDSVARAITSVVVNSL